MIHSLAAQIFLVFFIGITIAVISVYTHYQSVKSKQAKEREEALKDLVRKQDEKAFMDRTFQGDMWRRETEEEWNLRMEKQLQGVIAVREKLQAKLKQGIENRKAWEHKRLQSEEGDLC